MTLGTRLSRRDEAAFVGRARELEFFDGLFVDDPAVSVVLVHGPAGIGKSTLLREVERRGERAGWRPWLIEGRDVPPVPDALDDAFAGAAEAERPLLLFDSYERMASLGGHLRRTLLPSLPDNAIVVIAGRRPPEPGWFEGGWESLCAELELEPLSEDEARELLASQGVGDERRKDSLAHWAGGFPLALTLAADAAEVDPGWSPSRKGEPPEMVRAMIRRLIESELDAVHRDVLAVAAISRTVTADLIRDALPGIDAVEALEWLRQRTFAEPRGDGLTLQRLVRQAARADLRQNEPERERELRRRVADHLHARAVAGRLLLTIDLADLVESREIRDFYSWQGAGSNRIDALRAGDAEQVAMLLAASDRVDWWETTRPWFEQAPEYVAVARDAGDALCGFSVSTTPDGAPALAAEDPILGRWLEHAREHAPDANAVLWRCSLDFTDSRGTGVQAMLDMDGILRSGLANPRFAYLPIDTGHGGAEAFSEAVGARHLPDLDVRLGETVVECHLLDYGQGGLLGMQRDVVYLELGLTPPGDDAGGEAPPRGVDPEVVREALRNLHVPHELARSELAVGDTPEERAASVRELLEKAAASAFGDTDNERLLQRVLMRGYIDPAPSQEAAADELNLSRAAYFRRLKLASERVAEYLTGAL